MRIIAIGDIHGRPIWKPIIEKESFDKVIFVGDYFDSKEGITGKEQINNFEEILHFKRLYSDKVVLLIGNHDYHYFKYVYETFPGFQAFEQPTIQKLLEGALQEDLLQICYRHENFLFSHAGVSGHWFGETFEKEYQPTDDLESLLNNLFKTNRIAYRFVVGPDCDYKGNNTYQSPLWIRPEPSLVGSRIKPFTHIVGHTIVKSIDFLNKNIILIDALGTSGEYLIIEDNFISVSKLTGSNENNHNW